MSITKKSILIISIFLLLFTVPEFLRSHCQVPCGIYDDEMRIKMISEHITTIEKAMKEVVELSKESKPNYNQIVRWVFNKEKHAEELSEILTYYFMAQRIQPIDGDKKETQMYTDYQKRLELLHHLLIYSMKAKQTTNLSIIEKLRALLKEFKKVYFSESPLE